MCLQRPAERADRLDGGGAGRGGAARRVAGEGGGTGGRTDGGGGGRPTATIINFLSPTASAACAGSAGPAHTCTAAPADPLHRAANQFISLSLSVAVPRSVSIRQRGHFKY